MSWSYFFLQFFVYKHFLSKSPSIFSNIRSNTHEQNTRSTSHGLLTKPSCSTSKYSINAFAASAIKSWNFSKKGFCNNNLCQLSYLLQKKAIWIISFASFDAHTIPIFAKLNIIKCPDLISFCNCLSINIFWVSLLQFFSNIFVLRSNTHEQNTRSASHGLLTRPPCITSKYGINAFAASAIKWLKFFQKRFSNGNLSQPTLDSNCWL